MAIMVDETICVMCKQPFDPPRRVKWGRIGFDMKAILGPWDRLDPGVDARVEAPVCGQCWEPLAGEIDHISIHPDDLPRLPRAKPLERLTDGSAGLLGIPVVIDDSLPPGKVDLHYSGKTRTEIVEQYQQVMALLNPKE